MEDNVRLYLVHTVVRRLGFYPEHTQAVSIDRSSVKQVDMIVGLGNPGSRYQHTRHNFGFDVLDALARRHRITLHLHAVKALCGQGRLHERPLLLVKPQTFMNASGQVVARLVSQYLRDDDLLIVVHDDIDLPLGKIKLKHRGGDAGHRGIRSIIACLGTGEFSRVRLGIGRPLEATEVIDYVLSPFTAEEMDTYKAMIPQAIEHIETLLTAHDRPCGLPTPR